jgi:hypothetical protein
MPRATPVTNATLPSSRPMAVPPILRVLLGLAGTTRSLAAHPRARFAPC